MRDAERQTILGEWMQASLQAGGWHLPVDDVERELRTIAHADEWAVTPDARTLYVLDGDTLHTVTTTDEREIESTLVRPLKGETIVVRQWPQPPRPYQDTGTLRETDWAFTYANGEELLRLTGVAITDRINGGVWRDQSQKLAEAIAGLADRNQ